MPRLFLLLLVTAAVLLPAEGWASDPRCAGTTSWSDRPAGTGDAQRELATWLANRPIAELDRVLMTPAEIDQLNAANTARAGTWQDVVRKPPREPREVDAELEERIAHMRRPLESGAWLEARPGSFGAAIAIARGSRPVSRFQVAVAAADLRCVPERSGLFTRAMDRDFDRNRCSVLHTGELVRVDRVSADGRWLYVRAGHGVGWLEAPDLTPPLSAADAVAYRDGGDRLVVVDDWVPTARGAFLRLGTSFPIVAHEPGRYQILVPTLDGLADDWVDDDARVHEGFLPLTRRSLLELVMRRVGDPYGWGGTGGGRDCSRLLHDAFATFGVRFGRHSGVIGESGRYTVDVAGMSDRQKRDALRAADGRGIVFLYMPGHIMLYLGELDGVPWALSAISEYLVPCAGGGHRTVRLDRVDVTTLELGRGTERTAFIERITRLAVFGP
ncbi:MAG: hypothetical protein EP329_21370 [Deltaproteobacteria bacterium]|nr:MAG: hypothetical protein EP329_21370 [Deltaproteobacteria bacterium]